MSGWTDHILIAPIVVPMMAGAVMIALGERQRRAQAAIGLVSTTALLVLAIMLLLVAETPDLRVYRLGDWPAVFGIVLVLDRLSALMLVLTSLLGLAAYMFSLVRWHQAGVYFHPLFQFQFMGLNGAFLTGDLFNLFVFFEVMLAASYGMALHGSGTARVRAGLHYIIINLVASLLFLVGVSVIYGIAGTLNMADLAARMHGVAAEDRALLEAGLAVMGIAFLIKAAMWPLGFWLPGTYAAAAAPAAAILSVLSKVGVYAVLRLWLLLLGTEAGASAGFGAPWLLAGGLLTVVFGSIAVLATQDLPRLAGASVIVSSGTLLAAVGTGQTAVIGGALYYLASSVLAIGSFFLLVELVERGREVGADVLAVTREAFGAGEEDVAALAEPGAALPGTVAMLGLGYLACTLLLAGLPPLSSFLAKFAILAPLLGVGEGAVPVTTWLLVAALILSGLATLTAMVRAGIDVFWAAPRRQVPSVAFMEVAPIGLLLVVCGMLTIAAEPTMRYMLATAEALSQPVAYLQGVMSDPAAAVGTER